MLARKTALLLSAFLAPAVAQAADLSCNGLVSPGQKMICAGFEPNWAVELICNGKMTSNFIDAFSGNDIQTTPGSVSFSSQTPWVFQTNHGIAGSIAYTPAGCADEGDNVHDSPSPQALRRASVGRFFRSAAGWSRTSGILRGGCLPAR